VEGHRGDLFLSLSLSLCRVTIMCRRVTKNVGEQDAVSSEDGTCTSYWIEVVTRTVEKKALVKKGSELWGSLTTTDYRITGFQYFVHRPEF
jgi:hypothetical protein